jgi:small subunit ribosomal protein S5
MPQVKKKFAKEDEVVQEALQEEEEREEKVIKQELKKEEHVFDKDSWKPISGIGKKIKSGEIKDIDEILDKGLRIVEPEIVDCLVPGLSMDLLLVGQSKGKFGGGRRRVFRQTQKKTREGNKPKFATVAVVGNGNGYVGIGYGKSKETVPAREKAIRRAKLNIIKIKRGCGSWQCGCREAHTIPYEVSSKVGSTIIKLMPAPKGTGLAVEKECAKILKAAGIKDIWSKTQGQTKTKINLIYACFDALKKLTQIKLLPKYTEELGIVEGALKKEEAKEEAPEVKQ